MRIILIRHGQPHIALSPRTSHREFRDYIDAYEAAGGVLQSAEDPSLMLPAPDVWAGAGFGWRAGDVHPEVPAPSRRLLKRGFVRFPWSVCRN